MAKYLLLKFDDELDLENCILREDIIGHPEIIAVYKAPTAFCECGTKEGAAIKRRGWTKGRRWGWWVCDICGSLSKMAHDNLIRSEALGYNLLDNSIERQRD